MFAKLGRGRYRLVILPRCSGMVKMFLKKAKEKEEVKK